jgi:hypothetical protein
MCHEQDIYSLGGDAAPNAEWRILLSFPDRFCNPFSMRVRDDFCNIEWKRGEICLRGERVHTLRDVTALSLVSPPFPWLVLIIMNPLLIGLSAAGMYQTLSLANPTFWIMIVILNIVMIWSTLSMKWIRVTCQNKESGREEAAYLLPVTPSGWRRFDGASQQLLALLTNEVLADPRQDQASSKGQPS